MCSYHWSCDLQSSRKTRYPEDFGWNLQNMVTIILAHIRESHTVLSAKVCTCVCSYDVYVLCVCVRLCIIMCVYICTYMCVHNVCTYVCVCVRLCIIMCMYICTYMCVHMYVHVCTYVRTCVYIMYVHTYVYVCCIFSLCRKQTQVWLSL